MTINRRQFMQLGGAALGLAALPGVLHAQPKYPAQPVRLIVPFTAGSTTDVIGRAVAERLENGLNASFIVENRPGAGGVLGATMVARSAADGHTVLIHSAGHLANSELYSDLQYDTLGDFTPVTRLAAMPNVVVATTARGFKSLADMVAQAKAAPGDFTYGSSGNGSGAHIAGEKFRVAVGLDVLHVPYRGTPEAINDVIAGRIDWFFLPLALALPMVKSGKLIALAISDSQRSPLLPDVPTTTEAGFPGVDNPFWVGMFVPSKTPDEVVKSLHAATVAALESDVIRTRFDKLGAQPTPMPQAEFEAQVKAEMESTSALIRQAGIRNAG